MLDDEATIRTRIMPGTGWEVTGNDNRYRCNCVNLIIMYGVHRLTLIGKVYIGSLDRVKIDRLYHIISHP